LSIYIIIGFWCHWLPHQSSPHVKEFIGICLCPPTPYGKRIYRNLFGDACMCPPIYSETIYKNLFTNNL
jgi:hypothetical protein